MADSARYGSLPFQEQIDFFRQKLNLPTAAWTDIWEGQHARAFTVAGALKEDLLSDFRAAVERAIADGVTLADFRKDFDAIVARHGWAYNGGRGWRSRVIYETNLRTAYAAGRYRQMTDPDTLAARPYWRYKHNDSVLHPRPMHLAWNGLVLPADSAWWKTHYPPNGWGCKCKVFALGEQDLARYGKDAPDQAPSIDWETHTVGKDGPSPRTVDVPKGIDPGWAYNVGDAAYGRPLAAQAMDAWQAQKGAAWERLTPGDWQSYGRPERVPVAAPRAALGNEVTGAEAAASLIATAIGGPEKVFRVPTRGGSLPVLVDATVLADHLDPARSPYIPFLPELLEDPYEVWLAFERHQGTGKIELRTRIVKVVDTGGAEGLLLVAQASRGQLLGWTVLPTSDMKYLNRQRTGLLLYGN